MSQQLRALIVEDSPDDFQLLLRELQRNGYEVDFERVETEDAMRSALANREWDLVICDYSLPQLNALRALNILHASGHDLPFIIVSGTIGEETAIEALKAGANDFVIKGSFARLSPAIQRELRDAEVRRERKKTEVALRSTQARLSGILDIASDAIIGTDERQTLIFFNQGSEQIFGYRAAEVLGQPIDVLIPERFIRIHREHMNNFLHATETARRIGRRLEIFGRRKDGSEFPAEATISKLRQGGETTFTVILRDTTERKRSEAALRKAEFQYRSLVEQLPIIVYINSSKEIGDTIYVSPQIEQILGYTSEEWLANPKFWQDAIDPEDRADT